MLSLRIQSATNDSTEAMLNTLRCSLLTPESQRSASAPPEFTARAHPPGGLPIEPCDRDASGIPGDSQRRWDFSFIKTFPIKERVNFQFSAEVYDALNKTSFNNPNTNPTNSPFGRITGTQMDPRNSQLAAKLAF